MKIARLWLKAKPPSLYVQIVERKMFMFLPTPIRVRSNLARVMARFEHADLIHKERQREEKQLYLAQIQGRVAVA